MKIDTISTYILVYLLTCVRINVFVTAKADGGQTSSSSQSSETQSSFSTPKTPKNGVDLNIKSDTKTTNKYDYKKVGEYVTYTAKDNNAFKLVKDDKTEVWKATDSSEYSSKVEVDIMNKHSKAITIHLVGTKTKLYVKDCNSESWNEIDLSKVNPSSVYIDYKHESYICTNELNNNVRTFTAKAGFAFKGANEYINNDKVEIWKTDDESEYVNKIEVDLMNNEAKAVTIYFPDNKTKVYKKDCKDDPWSEIDTTKVNAKSVIITDNKETYFYSNKLDNDVRTFEAKNHFAFNFVKEGNTDIWTTANENEYSKKVVSAKRHSGIHDVTIHLVNKKKKLYIKESDSAGWKEIDITKVTPKPVNIGYEHHSYYYKNESQGKIRIFTSVEGFAFNSANEFIDDKKVEIWKTNKESEYVNRIEIHTINNVGGKAVTIYLDGNKTKVFKKSGKNEAWTEIDTTEVNTKSVNIQDRDDTYFYSNKPDNNVSTFEAKYGFTFNGFKEGDNNVWTTTNESEYANKVVSAKRHSGIHDVTIHSVNKKKKLFIKERDSAAWKEIDLSEVNTRSMNIRYDKETYFYSNKLQGSTRTFEAKDGFAFNEVNEYIGDKKVEIWKTTIEKEYSKKVVAEGEDIVAIYMSDATIKAFKKRSDDNWSAYTHDSTMQSKKTTEPQSSSTAKTAKTFTDLNITSYTESTVKFDYNKYNTYVTYTAKDDYVFNVVKEGNTEVWKATDESNYSGRVEVDLMNNDAKAFTVYLDEDKTRVYTKSSKNGLWTEIDTTKVNPKLVNIHYQYDSYFYTNKSDNNVRTFEARHGFTFNGFREGDNSVWTTTNESEYAYKVVSIKRHSDNLDVTIHLVNGGKKLFIKETGNDHWAEIDTTKVNPKSVNIQYQHDSYFYTNMCDNDVRTFEARDGFAFNGFREGNSDIWTTTNESEYANKVVSAKRHSGILDVTFYRENLKKKLFIKTSVSEGWKEIDLAKVNPNPVNIGYQHESYFYTNTLDDGVRTFEAKTGFVFNGANKYINNDKIEIWKSDNVSGYANKLVSAKSHSGIIDLTIHLVNGGRKLFINESDNEPWKEIDVTIVNPKSVNIEYQYDSHFYTNKLDKNVRTFEAKYGFAFNGFREGNTDIWTTTNESEYAKKIEVDLMNNDSKAVTFYIGDKTKLFMKCGKNESWTETDTSKINRKSINIDYPHDSYFFTNKLDDGVRTFETKTGFGFECAIKYINNNRIELWKADNEYEYAIKVVSAKRSYGKLDLTVYLDNGKKKIYIKESDSEGWKEIDLSQVNARSMNIRYDKETYFYSNKLQGSTRTFEARDGFAFNVVNEYIGDKKVEIWKTTIEKEYSKKVVAKGDNKVTIYIGGDGTRKVFNKTSDNKWNEDKAGATSPDSDDSTQPEDQSASSTRSEVRLLKVNPFDTANPLELDANEYTYTQSGNVAIYHINVDCVQLMLEGVLLWVHDSSYHGGIYPKSVYHDTSTDVLLLRFEGLDITFQNTNEGWVFTESGPLAVKFYIVDPNDSNNSVELDSTQLTISQSGEITTFNIAEGVNSIAIMYGSVLLWQHDQNQHDGKHPRSLYYSETNETLVLRFDGLDLTFTNNDQGQWEYTETDTSAGGAANTPSAGESSTQSQVKLFKVNPSDASNVLELDASEYTSTTSDNVVSYEIAGGVNCVQLMLDNLLLWAHDSTKISGIYPKSVYHDTSTDVLLLRFEGLDITFQNTNEGWVFTESGPLAVKFYIVDPNDSNNSVELDSTQLTISQSGEITTFNIAEGVNSIAIMYGSVLLWQHDQNQRGGKHPKSLDFTKSTETLVLMFDGFYLTFAKNDQGQWEYTETDTSAGGAANTPSAGESSTQSQVKLFKVNPSDASNVLELDASEYTSTTSDNVVSYEIAGGVNCVQLMLDNLLLWAHDSTKISGIYPKSVYHDTSTDVLLLRFEGLDITFQNTNEGWVFTESGPLAVKFYIVDPNDSNNSVELDSTQLTISQSGEITTFNIAEGVNSIAIMYGSVLLWQHDQNQHDGKHPRSLYYSETNETLVLRFDGLDLTFTNNDQGQWEYTETDTSAGGAATTPPVDPSGASKKPEVKLFKVNPSDASNVLELDASEYTSTTSDNVVSYEIAGGVNCVQLMLDNLLLWAHDSSYHGGIYPKSVDHDTNTDVILLKFEGLDITFAKNDQGQWEYTETDTSGT